MIRITQTFGAFAGRVLELEREVVRFGRLPDNDVCFDPHADLDASGRHAELRKDGVSWVVVDVGSRNGTLVAGQRVTRHVLRSGDEVEFGLGGPRVRIELEAGAPSLGDRAGAATGAATPLASAAPSAPGIAAPRSAPPSSPFSDPAGPMYPAPRRSPGGTVQPTPHMPQVAPASSQPAVPPAPGGEKKYGQKTVGVMIQAALQQAEQQRDPVTRSPEYVHAVAAEAARSSSRGLKIAVGALALLLFATLGAVVAVFFYTRTQERELRDENVRLQRELSELGAGDAAERERIEGRLQELNDQLADQQEAAGSRIADRNERAVYALVKTRPNGRAEVVCSSFAVRPNLLATNARCVGAIERAMARSEVVRAMPNGAGEPVAVDRLWRHPAYNADVPASPDVGLIRVRGTLPVTVQLAQMSELTQVSAGDDVFVLGFPDALAPNGTAAAGLTSGVVGRATSFDGSDAPIPQRHLISHSAFTDDGTAGSPLFDRHGRVVAVNAGNFRARERVTDTGTRVSRTVESDTPYAWAVRADLLLQLLAGLPAE